MITSPWSLRTWHCFLSHDWSCRQMYIGSCWEAAESRNMPTRMYTTPATVVFPRLDADALSIGATDKWSQTESWGVYRMLFANQPLILCQGAGRVTCSIAYRSMQVVAAQQTLQKPAATSRSFLVDVSTWSSTIVCFGLDEYAEDSEIGDIARFLVLFCFVAVVSLSDALPGFREMGDKGPSAARVHLDGTSRLPRPSCVCT